MEVRSQESGDAASGFGAGCGLGVLGSEFRWLGVRSQESGDGASSLGRGVGWVFWVLNFGGWELGVRRWSFMSATRHELEHSDTRIPKKQERSAVLARAAAPDILTPDS